MKNFIHAEKLKKVYTEHPHPHYLGSSTSTIIPAHHICMFLAIYQPYFLVDVKANCRHLNNMHISNKSSISVYGFPFYKYNTYNKMHKF